MMLYFNRRFVRCWFPRRSVLSTRSRQLPRSIVRVDPPEVPDRPEDTYLNEASDFDSESTRGIYSEPASEVGVPMPNLTIQNDHYLQPTASHPHIESEVGHFNLQHLEC